MWLARTVRAMVGGSESRIPNEYRNVLEFAAYEFKTPPGVTSVTNRMSHITTDLSFTPPHPWTPRFAGFMCRQCMIRVSSIPCSFLWIQQGSQTRCTHF